MNYVFFHYLLYRKNTKANYNDFVVTSNEAPQLRFSAVDSESTASSLSSSESIPPRFMSPVQRLSMWQSHSGLSHTRPDSLPDIPELQNLPNIGDFLDVRVTLAPNPTSFMVSQ